MSLDSALVDRENSQLEFGGFYEEEQPSMSIQRSTRSRQSFSWFRAIKELFLSSYLNVLMVLTPLGLAGPSLGWGSGCNFTLALLALVPFAERIGWATEQAAEHTNKTLGGLLNATFGNVTELIVCCFAIKKREFRVVQLSMLGSIISNMLLVLGCSYIAGGIKQPQQKFNKEATDILSTMLVISSIALLLPAALSLTDEGDSDGNELAMSRFSAIIMLLMYCCLMVFQLKTHTGVFEDGEEEEEEEVVLSLTQAVVFMAAITGVIAGLSAVIVDEINEAGESVNISSVFLSAVVLPIVGNATEHAVAVVFAYKNKLDLSIGVAIGSSCQIALMVIPLCIIIAWCADRDLSLYFEGFETVVLFCSVFVTVTVLNAGKANYLQGCLLVGTYLIVCGGFLQHDDEDLD